MNVDFNKLRKQACDAYDCLTKKLNDETKDGIIEIKADYLDDVMNELRSCIASIAACYSSNPDDEVDDVLGDRELVLFNPEEDGE